MFKGVVASVQEGGESQGRALEGGGTTLLSNSVIGKGVSFSLKQDQLMVGGSSQGVKSKLCQSDRGGQGLVVLVGSKALYLQMMRQCHLWLFG